MLLRQMELNKRAKRLAAKRDREWRHRRELEVLPQPTERFSDRGCVAEVFVVKSRMIQPFTRNVVFFRLGSVVREGNRPSFCRFFNRHDVTVLRQQFDRLKRWLDTGAHYRAPGKISSARWEASTNRLPTPQCEKEGGGSHKGIGCFPTTFARRGHHPPQTDYRLFNETNDAHSEEFFRETDLYAVEEVLIRLMDGNCDLLLKTYDVEEADRSIIDVTPHRLKHKK